MRISWIRKKFEYINTTHLKSIVSWPAYISLCYSDGTSKVLDKYRDKDKVTELALVTGEITPFALAMLVRRRGDIWKKSEASNVTLSVAPELRSHVLHVASLWLVRRARLKLLEFKWERATIDIMTGCMRERWDSAAATASLPRLPIIPVPSRHLCVCRSCHQFGYLCNWKQFSRVCFWLPQWEHFLASFVVQLLPVLLGAKLVNMRPLDAKTAHGIPSVS